MSMHATAQTTIEADMSLATLLARLEGLDDSPLSIAYRGREVQPGYHVTEVKAGSYSTLDCGGKPDSWQETVLQVEDIPAEGDKPMLTVGKFRRILAQVDHKVRLAFDSRLTIEIGRPGEAMGVYDVAGVGMEEGAAVMRLAPRAAICKPRHRAETAAVAACCGGRSSDCC